MKDFNKMNGECARNFWRKQEFEIMNTFASEQYNYLETKPWNKEEMNR